MDALVDAIYSRFLLRDLFAKIVPGSIAMYAVTLVYQPGRIILDDVPAVIWMLLLGAAWIVGLAIQEAGQILGIIRFHKKETTANDYRMRRLKAHRSADGRESQVLERFLVLKEAAAVGSLAFACLAAALAARAAWRASALLIAVALVTAALLWLMNRRMVGVEDDYINTILEAGPPNPNGGESGIGASRRIDAGAAAAG